MFFSVSLFHSQFCLVFLQVDNLMWLDELMCLTYQLQCVMPGSRCIRFSSSQMHWSFSPLSLWLLMNR